MYISFYITDTNNALIFQFLINSNAPSFRQILTKLQSIYPELGVSLNRGSEKNESFENGGKFLHGNLGTDLEIFGYYSKINRFYYWCLKSRSKDNTDLDPYVLLEQIDVKLMDYYDKDGLSVKKISNNYDQISLIFYWMINGGEPNVGKTSTNFIKENVPMKVDLSKVFTSTAQNIQKAIQSSQAQKPIFQDFSFQENKANAPWRSQNVKHNNNEIYIDLVESVHVVYQTKIRRSNELTRSKQSIKKIVNGYLKGTAYVQSFLNGNPLVELQLELSGNDIGHPSFHECVDIDEYLKNIDNSSISSLKFIPPDGKFTLMDYTITLDPTKEKEKSYGSFSNRIGMVDIFFEDGLGSNGDEFEVSINIGKYNQVTEIKNLKVELHFSATATNNGDFTEVKPSNYDIEPNGIDGNKKSNIQKFDNNNDDFNDHGDDNNNTDDDNDDDDDDDNNNNNNDDDDDDDDAEYKIKMLRSTHGRFENSISPNKSIWIFDETTPSGISPTLNGCVEYSSKTPITKMYLSRISLHYEHIGQLASGIRVKTLNIVSGLKAFNDEKLFKGVKYATKTDDYSLRIKPVLQ
ncbi:hypothetical protein Kpol_1018p42 [Vanderwaltozyma polyspora DSM 70294]|uniref:MHD domain-containing protein n=1 Tax=Vanderwaltozyma polyspora (strain ATCC 22028 / DSM 70294 / BCRC 21397 / CBS 2163 / NBRC 10782 / NRRL Y-8283 / UCD 57-17) TaxID=436907 RepID=A7TDP1_VANPO|nr:uncharacterized protein Kpol_1018p42 [Vanderwaltozyma polyspora DSM 70294]EDO19511.1 hypothetical protein Kpol_1018p42 [Vanderwaltozyma polyspora DSM 70294]